MTISKYIGLPYKDNGRDTTGIDCWGLARLYYKEELGIDLPSYSTEYNGETSENIKELITQHKESWVSTDSPQVGDLVLFNIYGEPTHIGIYVGDSKFLHSREGKDSVIESLSSQQWEKRIVGFYKYSKALILSSSVPHPLRTVVHRDWTVAGTTVQQFAEFIKNKYKVSEKLFSKIVILIDGVPVKNENWETTVLQEGQTLAYRAVPGKDAARMVLMVVVAIVAIQAGLAFSGVESVGALGSATTAAQFKFAAAVVATNMAGAALANAIFPIRNNAPNDPGQANQLNLFNGASNQANRFGAIPVVLGKVRMSGILGATPYVESLTDTTILNLLLIWGFGPLEISDIQIGTSPITDYYSGFAQELPLPVNLPGYSTDNQTTFNSLYGKDVEQEIKQVELVNDSVTGNNPWVTSSISQPVTGLDIALTFPEGMRQITTKGSKSGEVSEATAVVEIQYKTASGSWTSVPNYYVGDASNTSATAFTATLPPTSYSTTTILNGDNGYTSSVINLYRWYTFALGPGGQIHQFAGAATDVQNADPSTNLINDYKANTYSSLLGFDDTYSRLPTVPSSFVKLYNVCVYGNTGYVTHEDLRGDSTNYTGFNLTYTNVTDYYLDSTTATYNTGSLKVNIGTGYFTDTQSNLVTGVENEIFKTSGMAGTQAASTWGGWCDFLKTYGVWNSGDTGDNFDKSQSVNFTKSGYYKIEAAADDSGDVYIGAEKVVTIPGPGYNNTVSNTVYIEAGTKTVRILGVNTGGKKAVACRITFNSDGFLNAAPGANTILTFGTNGFYTKRKDAFNFVYKIKDLPLGVYQVRVRRVNSDEAEPVAAGETSSSVHNYHKVLLFSVTGYNNEKPAINPPGCNLAKTAIRIQSSSKANGNIEGVNALLQTICYDWDGTHWTKRATNNPASLFLYVLTHPANAYRVELSAVNSSIDLAQFQHWHSYCVTKKLSYNSVLTSTQSVLEVLRDIAAAGKASPTFVDGKWSVVIDEPRSYPVQHFTPHNSWGFESTKILPKIPDGFRITYPDADKGYQPNEIIVYNTGKNASNSAIFEELRLPGVTNYDQAVYMAKWHFAQLVLRPETYTINTDFEYLVCTRGDWVKVAHDVPMWGTGTGRILSITGGGLTLKLSESIKLTAGKSYVIRIRTNASSNNSKLKTLTTITTTDYYDTITLTSPVTSDGVEVDNLFMLGEVNKETQDLIVISVEPTGETSARLTLVDYSPDIYNESFTNLVYNSNITGDSVITGTNAILYPPVITAMVSDNDINEQITPGNYQNILLVSFANPSKLSKYATKIELQIVLANSEFNENSSTGSYITNKDNGSITVRNLTAGASYKVRARYTNADGTLTGPWSDIQYVVATGRSINTSGITSMTAKRSTRFLNIAPYVAVKPNDFKYFEARVFKDPGTGDFWDNTSTAIKKITFTGTTSIDLKEFPTPRISDSPGTQYRIACRIVDNAGNYSSTSTLLTVLITKIAP